MSKLACVYIDVLYVLHPKQALDTVPHLIRLIEWSRSVVLNFFLFCGLPKVEVLFGSILQTGCLNRVAELVCKK